MRTGPDTAPPPAARAPRRTTGRWAPWAGLGVAAVLVGLAFSLPHLLDWEVFPRAPRSASTREVPPLHGLWDPKLLGPGTVPSVLLAVLGVVWGPRLAERLAWRPLLAASYAAGLAWLLSLALVDGTSGISRVLGNRYDYLQAARGVTDVHALLTTWADHIPIDSPDAFVTNVSGHPPGALLFFVLLDRLGLGGDLAAGLVVTVIAASTALAVMTTLRLLGSEATARRAAPFLVLAPAAVFMAVSADALFGAVAAWSVAALAVAATRTTTAGTVAWSVVAGLGFGVLVMMSYGLPLMAFVALAVLLARRRWLPVPVVAVSALAVVLAFAVGGFRWWEAYPVLHDRYWDGIAADRPASYWMWANLALLVVCAGPLLGAGLAHAARWGRRLLVEERPALLLAAGAATCIVLADASRMSKAEVERIWVPFVPWLLLTCALLPPRWRRWGLGLQVATAVVVQQLFYTSW